jgi:excisionase family DNA binding protein
MPAHCFLRAFVYHSAMTSTEGVVTLTVPEAALRLRVNVDTVRRWLRTGRLRGVKPGGDRSGYRIASSELDRLLTEGGEPQKHPRRSSAA